mgnify:CR=1 FL=1
MYATQNKGAMAAVLGGGFTLVHCVGEKLEERDANQTLDVVQKQLDEIDRELASMLVPPSLRDAHKHGLERYLDGGAPRIIGKRIEVSAMRSDGVVERLITGDASDWEKFEAWARTVPATLAMG